MLDGIIPQVYSFLISKGLKCERPWNEISRSINFKADGEGGFPGPVVKLAQNLTKFRKKSLYTLFLTFFLEKGRCYKKDFIEIFKSGPCCVSSLKHCRHTLLGSYTMQFFQGSVIVRLPPLFLFRQGNRGESIGVHRMFCLIHMQGQA